MSKNTGDPARASLRADTIIGLEAFSQDNQFIGRVAGLLPTAPDDVEAFEEVRVDPVGPDGRTLGPRHALIDAAGTPLQSNVIVEIDSLEVDLHGRRVTVPMTVAQLEALPRRSPLDRNREDADT